MVGEEFEKNLKVLGTWLHTIIDSLEKVGKSTLSGTILSIFLCNLDALRDKNSYSFAAVKLQQTSDLVQEMGNLSAAMFAQNHLQNVQPEADQLWFEIKSFGYEKLIDKLLKRFDASSVQQNLELLLGKVKSLILLISKPKLSSKS